MGLQEEDTARPEPVQRGRKQAPWPKWPAHKLTLNETERVRHKSLASPAMTGKEDFNIKMLEEKKSVNNYICHFALLPSGHGKFINIGGSHFFLTSPRALLETTCNVQKSIKRLKSLKYFNKFLAFTYFHPKSIIPGRFISYGASTVRVDLG